MGYDKLWKIPEAVARALSKIDAVPDDLDNPVRVSQHVSYRIDDRGHEESMRVRRLVRAARDNTHRIIFVTRCSTLPQPPMVTSAEGCHPARFRCDVPTSTCVFELMLDRPLRAGDLASVEFTLRFPPGQTDQHAELAIRGPTRDLVMQVSFDPRRLPAGCHSYWQPRNTLPVQKIAVATFDAGAHSFQYITLDPPPGQHGLAWQWR